MPLGDTFNLGGDIAKHPADPSSVAGNAHPTAPATTPPATAAPKPSQASAWVSKLQGMTQKLPNAADVQTAVRPVTATDPIGWTEGHLQRLHAADRVNTSWQDMGLKGNAPGFQPWHGAVAGALRNPALFSGLAAGPLRPLAQAAGSIGGMPLMAALYGLLSNGRGLSDLRLLLGGSSKQADRIDRYLAARR